MVRIGDQYLEVIIHRSSTSELAFGGGCIGPLLDKISSKYGTLGKADKYLSRGTLYALSKKLGSQKSIAAETLFSLARTLDFDGFIFRLCVQSVNCACEDTT